MAAKPRRDEATIRDAGTPTDARLGGRMRAAVGVCVAAIVALSVLGLYAIGSANDAVQRSADAARDLRERLVALNGLLSVLQDAESGQRGYLLTRDARFLEPYREALPRIEPLLARLDAAGGSVEYRRVNDALRRQTADLLGFLAGSVELPQEATVRADRAPPWRQALDGKARMDGARATIATLRREVESALEASWREFGATLDRSRSAALLTLGGAAAIALVLVAMLARYAALRRRAENAEHEASALLRATIDHITHGVVVLDRELGVVAWNRRFVDLRGLAADVALRGVRFHDVIRMGAEMKLDAERAGEPLTNKLPLIERRQSFAVDARRADGVEVEISGEPMPDGHYVVTYSDVTLLRRSERAARDQAARLKATLDHIVDGVVTVNESGSIESFSAGAEHLLGWRAPEVLRRDISTILIGPPGAALDPTAPLLPGRRLAALVGNTREFEARRKDGSPAPVEVSVGEMWLGDRRLYIAVLRDLSERQRVDRLQNDLLSTVSHEFRTPLTSIVGALGLLQGGVAGTLGPQVKRLVDMAHDNGHRLVRLVNDFLDLEKMRSGKLEFRLAPHALGPLLHHAVDAMRTYADEYGVRVEVETAPEELLAYVDPERVQQVLANLISNAVKFSPRGRAVHVTLARDGGAAVISVRDEGPGIPPEFQPRIFEKFAQADASDTRGRTGTGLGLSIVKSIVERLDGQVGFVTAPGAGTTFRVGLPLWHTREATITRHGAGRHVLAIEDDPDVAMVLGELLRSAGYDARTVGTGADALEAIAAAPVDAVLLDLHLPDVNGRTLIGELRARLADRHAPILILSATFAPYEIRDAAVLGADACFEKPIDGPRLLETLQRLLAADRDA
jgi:PAS domain S-box-containing protein